MDIRAHNKITVKTVTKTVTKIIVSILVSSTLLLGCSTDLEDFERALAVKRDGIYVHLSTEIQQAIALPDSQISVQLRVVDTSNGTETKQTPLAINNDNDVASDKTVPAAGEYRYHVKILFVSTNFTQEPLLLATASKISSSNNVEFSADELITVSYDSNGDGDTDADEKALLDFDSDDRSNLAEVLEKGNPYFNGPSFLSLAEVNVPEKQKISTNPNYIIYTAKAISPRPNVEITYAIESVTGPSSAPFFINSNTGELYLESTSDNPWPVYYPNDSNLDANTYTITVKASEPIVDSQSGVTASVFMDLTLYITNVLNLTATADVKTIKFSWDTFTDINGVDADHYKLFEDPRGLNQFIEITAGKNVTSLPGALVYSFERKISAHLFDHVNVRFRLEAYRTGNIVPISRSEPFVFTKISRVIGYIKAADTVAGENFGTSVSVSADGNTLAVGAWSNGTGVVYLYSRRATAGGAPAWVYLATLKAPNPGAGDRFGFSVGLNSDGSEIVVGAPGEDNSYGLGMPASANDVCTGRTLDLEPGCATDSGAVYVYQRPQVGWAGDISTPVAYLKAFNAGAQDNFGASISISHKGDVVAVGAVGEDDYSDTVLNSGAVYAYPRPQDGWSGLRKGDGYYVKAFNMDAEDEFGFSVSLSGDASILAVGAVREDNGPGMQPGAIITDGCDSTGSPTITCIDSGAVYLYSSPTGGWVDVNTHPPPIGFPRPFSVPLRGLSFSAYLKAPNADRGDHFGASIALNSDGSVLVVGAPYEDNAAVSSTGTVLTDKCSKIFYNILPISLYSTDRVCKFYSGAAYVFSRPLGGWDASIKTPTYLKANNAKFKDYFASSISLSANAEVIVIGSPGEDNRSDGTPKLSDRTPKLPIICNSLNTDTAVGDFCDTGAAYIFKHVPDGVNGKYILSKYLKAQNAGHSDSFGRSVSVNSSGAVLAVGAPGESSDFRTPALIQGIPTEIKQGVDTPVENNKALGAGAVYLY